MPEEAEDLQSNEEQEDSSNQRQERRKIPGSLPYTSSAGTLKKVLEKIPDAEKPSVFNTDFIGAVFGVAGGSARAIPPILKSTGMLSQNGAPTELYSQFQTESGRSIASLQLLKNGFPEIFKRNQYANKLGEKEILDIIVSITGLPRSEKVAKSILNTFQVFQSFSIGAREDTTSDTTEAVLSDSSLRSTTDHYDPTKAMSSLGLTYNINVVLPETTNVEVYNAIFKSIRANLLQ